ncbi:hypothetical protein PsorP6_018396 [Peronosclerospora sorghi]|nr:hypothetical protein PsorP6_018396 [Peronosclerospora sorghi]
MDVGNTNLSKGECSKKKLKHNNQQNKKPVQLSSTAMKSESEDEEEDMIDTIVIGHVSAEDKSNESIRKEGSLGDARAKIIIESGADHNIIRPRLDTHCFRRRISKQYDSMDRRQPRK